MLPKASSAVIVRLSAADAGLTVTERPLPPLIERR
jgi:hypothetical protein